MHGRVFEKIFNCLALIVVCGLTAHAQISSSTGTIQGRVTDPQGLGVPGAAVSLTNKDTKVSATGITQSQGAFVFPLLAPGNYRIEIRAAGFQEAVLDDVVVQVTQVTVANARLQIGQLSTQVVVSDAAQKVDTRTATTGDVITGDQVVAIPLPTRNFLDLTTLQAGVSTRIQSAATVGRGAPVLDVAGSRATTNNFVLDGVDANNFGSGSLTNVPVPNPDAIDEFRVSTSMYDASQGRGSGGNINVLIRSGTDKYHGDLFQFYRSDALNANDFFFNAAGKSRPVLLQNQFGGAIGGPVPKLRDTFWFFSYQGTRQKNGVSSAVTGSQPVLPDRPAGGTEAQYASALSTAFGVPLPQMDPVAVRLLLQPGQYGGFAYPSGSCAGTAGTCGAGSIGRLAVSLPTIYNEDQYSASGTRNLTSKNRLAAQFFYANISQYSPTGGGVSLGQGANAPSTNEHAAITDNHTFSPSLVNEFRAGFTNVKTKNLGVENITVDQIGMSKWDGSLFPGIPSFSVAGLLSFGGIGVNSYTHGGTTSTTVGDTLFWSHGKQTWRFGVEWRHYGWDYENQYATRGSLSFPNFASFLTGTPNRLQIDVGQFGRNFRASDIVGFAQNDYLLTSRLTLNLGLRYDYLGYPGDVNHRMSTFDPSLIPASCIAAGGGNCIDAGFVQPAALGGSLGTPGATESTQIGSNQLNFAPRIGFAYDLFGNGKLAVRGGYGIFYIRTSGQTALQPISAPPWVEQYLATGTAVVGSDVLSHPWPANLPQPLQFPILPQIGQFTGKFSASGAPIFLNADGSPAVSQALYGFTRNLRAPDLEQWNLNIQYELFKNWVMEVGYLGSHGVALLVEPSLNQALLVNSSNAVAYANPTIAANGFPNGFTVNTNSNANAPLRVPVPGFSAAGLNLVTNLGFSSYNAATFELRHSFAKSYQFRFDYTFSHSIDNDSGPAGSDLDSFQGNQLVPALSRARSDFDQPHRAVFTYVWDLPGPKQGFSGMTLGGWRLSGIYSLQSGLPFSVVSSTGGGLGGVTGSVTVRGMELASCTGGLQASGPVSQHLSDFINASCFVPVSNLPAGTVLSGLNPQQGPGNQSYTVGPGGPGDSGVGTLFGTAGRNILRGPFEQRMDLALVKTIRIREQKNLQVRAEAFKLFNNVIFANPSANISTYNSNPALNSFGVISSTLDSTGRIIQVALKLNF